jgi:hypothetical protein
MPPSGEKTAKSQKKRVDDTTRTMTESLEEMGSAIKGKRGRPGRWNSLQEVALEAEAQPFWKFLEGRNFQGGSRKVKGDDGKTVQQYIDKRVDSLFKTPTFSVIPDKMSLDAFRTVSSNSSMATYITQCHDRV